MKTLITIGFVTLVVLTSSAVGADVRPAYSKESRVTNCFNFLRVHRQGAGVSVSWAASGNDITQFMIERSYDNEYFEPVTEVPCSGSGTHKFKDDNVFPGTIYYRVVAVKADNSTECSPVESVRIVKRG